MWVICQTAGLVKAFPDSGKANGPKINGLFNGMDGEWMKGWKLVDVGCWVEVERRKEQVYS